MTNQNPGPQLPLADAISPLDGRYAKEVANLSTYFSEFALMKERVSIELNYLWALLAVKEIKDLITAGDIASAGNISNSNTDSTLDLATFKTFTKELITNFNLDEYQKVKDIEAKIKHDVKAVEIYLAEKIKTYPFIIGLLHFALTSEDVNNLAYASLLRKFVINEQLPTIKKLIQKLLSYATQWKNSPFPAHTHGQLATPITAGQAVAVFLSRLYKYYTQLSEFKFTGKLNGATGNFAAHHLTFPQNDWWKFSQNFIQELGLVPNLITTQIEDHQNLADYFHLVRQINNILIDLNQDIWLYISYGYLGQIPVEKEVGSSTMPHKINPINFENSEGNLLLSNSLLIFFSEKLTRSRMQRDLTDSTVLRNMGVALGHTYLGYKETFKGLSKIKLNEEVCLNELTSHPELLAEAIQNVLRIEVQLKGTKDHDSYNTNKKERSPDKDTDPYSQLKKLTRKQKINKEEIQAFLSKLEISSTIKKKLLSLQVEEYTGIAPIIVDKIVAEFENIKIHQE